MPNLGLLQALADPFNEPLEEPEEMRFAPKADPVLQALIRDPSIDPIVRTNLRERRDRAIREDRLNFELAKIETTRRHKEENAGLVSFLGPVPIGFQVGTYLGVKNPVARFLTDVLVDPLNLIAGVGSLTKLGRSAKFLKGLSPAQKAEKIVEGAELLAKVGVDDALRAEIQLEAQAIQKGFKDPGKLLKLFKKAKKQPLGEAEFAKLKELGAEDDFINLLKNKRDEIRGLKSAFKLSEKEAVGELKKGFLDRVLAGQSALVNLGIPFTDVEVGALRFPSIIKAFRGEIDQVSSKLKAGASSLKETAKEIGSSFKLVDTRAKLTGEAIDTASEASVLRGLQESRVAVKKLIGPKTSDVMRLKTRAMAELGKDIAEVGRDQILAADNFATKIEAEARILMGDPKNLENIIRFREGERGMTTWFKGLSEAQRNAVDEIYGLLDDFARSGVKAGLFEKSVLDDDVLSTYFPRLFMVDDPKNLEKYQEAFGKFMSAKRRRLPRTKHALPRSFATLKEAEEFVTSHPEFGLRLKSKDGATLLADYIRSMSTAITRNQMLQAMDSGKGFLRASDDLPMLLVLPGRTGRISAAANNAAELLKANRAMYEKFEGDSVFKGYYFHKDVFSDVKALFDRNIFRGLDESNDSANRFIGALKKINAIGKGSVFGFFPFFHIASLTWSNFAGNPFNVAVGNLGRASSAAMKFGREHLKSVFGFGDPLAKQKIVLDMWSTAVRRLDDGSLVKLNAKDMLETAMKSLQLGRVHSDQAYNSITNFLKNTAESLPRGFRSPIDGAMHWNDFSDFALWNVFHDSMKLDTWTHMMLSEIRRAPDIAADQAKFSTMAREVGKIADQNFGGIFDRLLISPKWKEIARFAALAPDWTLSNLMMARDMFVNMPGLRDSAVGKLLTRDVLLPDVRFRAAMAYNMRAAFYAYLAGNVMNYAFTSIKDGKGRFLWENDDQGKDPVTGLKTRIEMPYTRADGRRQFMDITKQFAEPLKLMLNPPEFAESKMGVLPRVFRTVVLGADGFGNKIYGTEDGPMKAIVERVWATTGQFVPITIQNFAGAASGDRSAASSAISTMLGVGIRSEDKEFFEQEQRKQAIQAALAAR